MMKQFSASFAGSYRRIIMLIASATFIGGGIFLLIFDIKPEYEAEKPGEVWIIDMIILLMALGIIWWLTFEFGLMVREFFQCSFFVEVGDEEVTGYNLWKQPKSLKLLDIVAVQPAKKLPFSKLPPNLVFSNANGQKLYIHSNIEPLGECIEAIVMKCPNLRTKDYGELDKNAKIWSGENKM